MSRDVGRRHGLDPALLRLWYRLAALAPIRPLAWEPPYATDVALKRQKLGSSHHGSAETNLTSIHEDTGLISGLTQ